MANSPDEKLPSSILFTDRCQHVSSISESYFATLSCFVILSCFATLSCFVIFCADGTQIILSLIFVESEAEAIGILGQQTEKTNL